MTDDKSPEHTSPAYAPPPSAAEPTGPAAVPAAAATPPPRPEPRARGSWHTTRVPLLVAIGALVLGCLLGVGGFAAGALVSHLNGRGEHSAPFERDRGFDDRPGLDRRGPQGNGGWQAPVPPGAPGPGPAPGASLPAPSASVPSAAAS